MNFWDSPARPDRKDSRPLYAQLSSILVDCLQQNKIPVGTPLPTENELMERFGLSRTTVRQAVQQLEIQGLIQKVQGKGTFVSPPKRRNQIRVFKSLESGLAEQGIYIENFLLEDRSVSPPAWAVDLGYPASDRIRSIKRLKILNRKPLALEWRIMPPDVAAFLTDEDIRSKALFDTLDLHPETQTMQVNYIISAIVARDELAEILEVRPGAPVIVRGGLYHNQSGRPVMAARLLCVAERIELRYEFHREDDNWGIVNVI